MFELRCKHRLLIWEKHTVPHFLSRKRWKARKQNLTRHFQSSNSSSHLTYLQTVPCPLFVLSLIISYCFLALNIRSLPHLTVLSMSPKFARSTRQRIHGGPQSLSNITNVFISDMSKQYATRMKWNFRQESKDVHTLILSPSFYESHANHIASHYAVL